MLKKGVFAAIFFLCFTVIGFTIQKEKSEISTGYGNLHHPVSTKNTEAQRYFDLGLTMVYAFNHTEAIYFFEQSLKADPELAMGYWGIALSLGPNINIPVDMDQELKAYEAVQKAVKLSSHASESEQAYINALAKRYSNQSNSDLIKLSKDYRIAMGLLTKRFPDDPDAATLYAESIMDLRPWQLWDNKGRPAEGTEELIAVLENVLKKEPNHIGANHYYIHAVEASFHPERGLPSAERLKTLVPAAGHLVHMPAHIYSRTGFYSEAAQANIAAIAADNAYLKNNDNPIVRFMYLSHNMHFLTYARCMEGRFADAKAAADSLLKNLLPVLSTMPMAEPFASIPLFVLVRFKKWDSILSYPKPEAALTTTTVIYRFARTMALAAKGQVSEADKEMNYFVASRKSVAPDTMIGMNNAGLVFDIAQNMAASRIALAKNDRTKAISLMNNAVQYEDRLSYDEPSDWLIPARESYGALLLMDGKNSDAEKVFRDDLEINPRNGRSLFGLSQALLSQGKTAATPFVQQEFDDAWRNADTKLSLSDL